MKKTLYITAILLSVSFAACKGNSDSSSNSDSGQTHVGSNGPVDTGLTTTPVETGGEDTSGNGQGSTNAPKDTVGTN